METHGVLAPETADEVRAAYEDVGPAAQNVTRELAKAMEFSREEYDDRVTGEVVETARDALFANLLEVHSGSREEFGDWLADYDYEVVENGSDDVDRVAWHVVPFENTVVTASYQNEPAAARGTLRRIVHGKYYRETLSRTAD
ncbi:DUF5809 family protein [Salarchaeum sp. JOR-1]|uniref:DUF5809 family protein n=1 Tax=Salarchaeum sp. JOR-1 TaxID=2599399 RepID=UPI00119852EC|nr:DUF5809 family protein [Salarchaeum sp. JOR-1]QDX40032.1 hypothetical protein FQU85_03645 [Salarchaeum sp. JOR-1]